MILKNLSLTENLTVDFIDVFLRKLYPDNIFFRNKTIKDKKFGVFKPNFICDELKIIVEFRDAKHYMKSRIQLKDSITTVYFKELNYKIIEIPYFVQLTKEVIKILFDINLQGNLYKCSEHGFINGNMILPADFNSIGVNKFIDDSERFGDIIQTAIMDSLSKLTNERNEQYTVLPDLFYSNDIIDNFEISNDVDLDDTEKEIIEKNLTDMTV